MKKNSKKENQKWLLIAVAALFIYLLTRKKKIIQTATIRTTENGTFTPKQLAGMYASLISSPGRVFITDEAYGMVEVPWQIDLAKFTTNYAAVQAEFAKYYGGNLTDKLIEWFDPAELSEYVAALYKNGQLLLP